MQRIRDEIFRLSRRCKPPGAHSKNLPEKKGLRWGESLTAEKMKQCPWVKPKPGCQVEFVQRTDAGHLRHCTFVAMGFLVGLPGL